MLEWLDEWRDGYHDPDHVRKCMPGKDICYPVYQALRRLVEKWIWVQRELKEATKDHADGYLSEGLFDSYTQEMGRTIRDFDPFKEQKSKEEE
jgi:hypothetical protein